MSREIHYSIFGTLPAGEFVQYLKDHGIEPNEEEKKPLVPEPREILEGIPINLTGQLIGDPVLTESV